MGKTTTKKYMFFLLLFHDAFDLIYLEDPPHTQPYYTVCDNEAVAAVADGKNLFHRDFLGIDDDVADFFYLFLPSVVALRVVY